MSMVLKSRCVIYHILHIPSTTKLITLSNKEIKLVLFVPYKSVLAVDDHPLILQIFTNGKFCNLFQ